MRWLLSGCLLGALGALLKHWQSPSGIWVGLSGFVIVIAGVFRWLNSSGQAGRHHHYDIESPGWGENGDGGSDCGGSDGGCGGD